MNTHQYPACWRDAHTLLTTTDRVALYGPPGTGKTHSAIQTAPEVILRDGTTATIRARRVAMTGDNGTADLLGFWQPNNTGAWHYVEGIIPRALREGSRVVIDEVDRASAEALGALLLACDTSESIEWENPETLEIVRPRTGYSVVFTTNLEEWSRLDAALRDRMVAPVRIDTPHPDALARLPLHLQSIAATTADLPPDQRISMRAWLTIAQLADRLRDEPEALRLVLGQSRADEIASTIAMNASLTR